MAIKLGNTDISDIKLGDKQVSAVYVGDKLVWEKVQTLPTDYILAYSFNGNTADASVNGLNGAMTGELAFDAGRKVGTQSMKFTNGCVKTIMPIPLNSDKVSISFWMKTTQTGAAVIAEMSPNFNANNAFGSFINNSSANKIDISDHINANAYNVGFSAVNINNGNWFHAVIIIDRNLGVAQNQIYINGSLSYTQNATHVANLVGNFVNNILFIGQRNASSIPFVGNLQDLKIYNRVLSEEEITALYNE